MILTVKYSTGPNLDLLLWAANWSSLCCGPLFQGTTKLVHVLVYKACTNCFVVGPMAFVQCLQDLVDAIVAIFFPTSMWVSEYKLYVLKNGGCRCFVWDVFREST